MKIRIPIIQAAVERQSRFHMILAAIVLIWFEIAPPTQGVSPAPDGGYPGGNTAEGQNALFSLSTGTYNTAVGFLSLANDMEGQFNTAIGAGALLSTTTGSQNTANGAAALLSNTTGVNNTAIGAFALFSNTTASENTVTGSKALFANTTGTQNTAEGANALASNTTGSNNTANGYHALLNNTTGDFNTANGLEALLLNTTGVENTAGGYQALVNNTTGFGNIALGVFAGAGVSTANNVIAIGAGGANIDNSCFIGQIYSNVQPVVGTDPDYVTISGNGRLGRSNLNGSSRRFKHDIQPMDKASEVLFALKPVSFRYNEEYDVMQRLSFGLIAEEVAEVAPDLVGRNKRGEPDSVRYEQINAMLLNEFLKAHRKMGAQQEQIEALTAELKQQAEQIQRVSDEVEMNRPAPRVASRRD